MRRFSVDISKTKLPDNCKIKKSTRKNKKKTKNKKQKTRPLMALNDFKTEFPLDSVE